MRAPWSKPAPYRSPILPGARGDFRRGWVPSWGAWVHWPSHRMTWMRQWDAPPDDIRLLL